ncbi:MAG: DUF167 domain-containing protein [Bacteriovoracia bacterium]
MQSGWLVSLWVQPGASKTEIVGLHGERLKVKIKAPPIEGAANDELMAFLCMKLGLTGRDIELVRGHGSRAKDLLISGKVDEKQIYGLAKK